MILDLVVLVPDKDIEQTCLGLLKRPKSLGIRPITYSIVIHPQKDPGCFHTGHELLTSYAREAARALVLLDQAWEGAPFSDAEKIARDVEGRLSAVWGDRGACVVIDPEVEVWIWSDSPHVAAALGWSGRYARLRRLLESEGVWPAGAGKPSDPKKAYGVAVRASHLSPSSSIFRRIAEHASLQRCTDPSFQKLIARLRQWFAEET